MTDNMWDLRFAEPGFAYGTRANEFLRASAHRIPAGRVLSLAEGEGRNAVFLASLGYDVTAVDSSPVGLAKARKLAVDRGVRIHTVEADLADFKIEVGAWQGIVSIYCHLPPDLRRRLHAQCVEGLAPGGTFVLEGFTIRQLQLNSGGPKDPALLMNRRSLELELGGLEFSISQEVDQTVDAGKYHGGIAAVVQLVAHKPAMQSPP